MATLTLSFEELLTRPLRQAQAHTEALRKEIKHRQSLLLDYDHHKVRPETVEEDMLNSCTIMPERIEHCGARPMAQPRKSSPRHWH